MKNINNHILKYLNYSGISHLIRYFSSNKPKIIMYHGIIDNNNQMRCWWQLRESDFKEQMRYLSSEFNVISIDELNESIINRRRLLRNSCVLTFDDGYHSYLTKALPILEYYKLPSVVYISPNVVQKQKMIWTDKLFCAVYRTSKSGLDLSDIELGKWDLETEKKKSAAAHRLINLLKTLPAERKNNLSKKVCERLDFSNKKRTNQITHPFKLLSRNEIRTISKNSLVTIGSHSLNHEILTQLSEVEVERELNESKRILEYWINKPVKHFSYPDGKYNSEIASIVKKCGYQTATCIGLGRFNVDKPFELNRLGTGSWDDLSDFKAMINGVVTMKIETKKYLNKLFKINNED